jgi:GMC oxidoreductase
LPSDGGRQALEVSADRVILAAGAIHSSRLLMASGLGGESVGQGLSANLGSHMTAVWPDGAPVRAFGGLQMSHYADDPNGEHMIETWFNPVMSQALVMPGLVARSRDEHASLFMRSRALSDVAGGRPGFKGGAAVSVRITTAGDRAGPQ